MHYELQNNFAKIRKERGIQEIPRELQVQMQQEQTQREQQLLNPLVFRVVERVENRVHELWSTWN